MGTQLLLHAVICDMSATTAHLRSIMSAIVRVMQGTNASAAEPEPRATDAALEATHSSTAAGAAPVSGLTADSSSQLPVEEGSSAAVAAGAKPVHEWVFEDVDCKGSCPCNNQLSNKLTSTDVAKLAGCCMIWWHPLDAASFHPHSSVA